MPAAKVVPLPTRASGRAVFRRELAQELLAVLLQQARLRHRTGRKEKSMASLPIHSAVNTRSLRTNHPLWFAINIGKHRLAKLWSVADIQSRAAGAGTSLSLEWPSSYAKKLVEASFGSSTLR